MKRREFLSTFAGAAAAWPIFAFAQQTQSTKRVGLMANLPLPPVQRFRERLQRQNLCPCRWISWSFGEPPVLFERAAEYLDKLLKGEKVSNLPVQQATAFELIVNSRRRQP
jgi:hypothetical protein